MNREHKLLCARTKFFEKDVFMQESFDYYDFAGIRLLTAKPHLEVLATGKKHTISKNHYGILLALAENAPTTVSYEKLWKEVWLSDNYDESSRHTIQTTKGHLVSWLKTIGITDSPITTDPGKGYFLSCSVTQRYESPPEIFDQDNNPHPVKFSAEPEIIVSGGSYPDERKYSDSGAGSLLNWKMITGTVVLAFILILMWKNSVTPRIEGTEFVSTPVPGKEFYLRLAGKNFNPEIVRLKVTGPGCGGDDPCTVKNGELRLYGQITELAIEKAPLTLAAGEYHLWLENEFGIASNKFKVTVPDKKQE